MVFCTGTHTNTFVCISQFISNKCLAVYLFLYIPQKDFKTRKKEKHATKIPSSLGLFIVDSSCFFVSGPRVKKKRGEKEKRENSKKITGKNEKNQKKKRRKSKKDKSARVHVSYLKRGQKQNKNVSQTQSYYKKDTNSLQDQRNTLSDDDSPLTPRGNILVIVY